MIIQGAAHIDEAGRRWYVKGNKRYYIRSADIFRSWRFATVFSTDIDSLEGSTEYGGLLGFRPGSILFSIYNMGYWYISDTGRHRVGSVGFIRRSGNKLRHIPWVSKSDLELHEELGVIE